MSEREEYDLLLKIVIIGDSGVGKSNLLSRFVRNEFCKESKTTIGVEFATKTLQVDDKAVKAQLWDTAGQERYRAITSAFFRGTVGAFVVYDITKNTSFENVERWMAELKKESPNVVVSLLGNKSDRESDRQVQTADARKFAKDSGMKFHETSAKEASNVEAAFRELIAEACRAVVKAKEAEAAAAPESPTVKLTAPPASKMKPKCCT